MTSAQLRLIAHRIDTAAGIIEATMPARARRMRQDAEMLRSAIRPEPVVRDPDSWAAVAKAGR